MAKIEKITKVTSSDKAKNIHELGAIKIKGIAYIVLKMQSKRLGISIAALIVKILLLAWKTGKMGFDESETELLKELDRTAPIN